MITVNPQNNSVTIVIENADAETLVNFQEAIIELVKEYNYKDFGGMAGNIVAQALNLLKELTPDIDQQIKAFADDKNYLPLPANITDEQTQAVRSLLMKVKYPDQKIDTAKVLKPFLNTI